MKTIIALASLAFLSTAAFATDPGCHPSQGNWVNAATQSCPGTYQTGKSDAVPPKPCEVEAKS